MKSAANFFFSSTLCCDSDVRQLCGNTQDSMAKPTKTSILEYVLRIFWSSEKSESQLKDLRSFGLRLNESKILQSLELEFLDLAFVS